MTQRDQDKKRKRPVILQTRVTKDEAALIREQAARAHVSVSALMRFAVLDQRPLRASRTPPLDHVRAAQLLSQFGDIASSLREVQLTGRGNTLLIEAAQRDLADMRGVLFEALGRQP